MGGVYELGEQVEIGGVFTRLSNDQPTDPSQLVITLVDPDGELVEVVDLEILTETPTEGDWRGSFQVTKPGIYTWKVVGTGSVEAVGTSGAYVRRSIVPEEQGS